METNNKNEAMELKELGISAAKQKQFENKGIYTVEDLAKFLPRKYYDFTEITGLDENLDKCCVLAVVKKVREYNNRVPVLQAYCETVPDKKFLIVTWFHQNFIRPRVEALLGKTVFIAGKATIKEAFGNIPAGYTIASPDVFMENNATALRVQPVYSKIQGMSEDYLKRNINEAVTKCLSIDEPFPEEVIRQYSDLSMYQTLCYLHFPRSMREVQMGRDRLLQDDLLYFAACNLWNSRNNQLGSPYQVKTRKLFNDIKNSLPYELTADQERAVNEMVDHASRGLRINALVQGDVGCGKTIVAVLMMSAFIGSGYQAVMMAPTQVLARQHYADMSAMFEPFGVRVAYLGTDLKASERKACINSIKNGDIQLIIGTHSVISDAVEYNNLAITITDEEHKFGVEQRKSLTEKAAAGVHSITMSATPIPRSLAQVMYGDTIQLHTITTMPAGRKTVVTAMATKQEKIMAFIVKEAKLGHQAYVVCPMIEPNEKVEGVRSVEEVGEFYENALAPYGIKVATLTGRDKKDKATETINRFHNGEITVLVATTVVEVGVNVPNATLIVIVDPDRFGLASLHQLRGRVGRSAFQSYCVLDGAPHTKEGEERLNALINYSSGFDIAKEDLRIRGAGEFIGTKQSGENRLLALMLAYPEKYDEAKKAAAELIDKYGWKPTERRDELGNGSF